MATTANWVSTLADAASPISHTSPVTAKPNNASQVGRIGNRDSASRRSQTSHRKTGKIRNPWEYVPEFFQI
jgi:hypothetical protein